MLKTEPSGHNYHQKSPSSAPLTFSFCLFCPFILHLIACSICILLQFLQLITKQHKTKKPGNSTQSQNNRQLLSCSPHLPKSLEEKEHTVPFLCVWPWEECSPHSANTIERSQAMEGKTHQRPKEQHRGHSQFIQ